MVLKRDELDATDWKILALLQKDARVTYQEIGRAVGLTRPAARERVLRMEERGVIARCGAELDAEAVGRALHVLVSFTFNPDAQFKETPNEALAPVLEGRPEVIRYWEVYGDLDFIIEAAFRSKDDLRAFLQSLRAYGFVRSHLIASNGEPGVRPTEGEAQ